MVGMRDVAKAAGVSLSTVSLVVNQTGYVSSDMQERVQHAMKQLNYIPNELARNFFRDRTNMIGVIVPTMNHPFFATLTSAVQNVLADQGFRTLLCSTSDTETGEAEYVDMLQRHMMDGIIMAAHTTHAPDYWTSINRPIVAFDRYLGEGIPSIASDHKTGGHLIARQLIDTHVRHVVSIGGPRSQFHDLQESYETFQEADSREQDNSTSFPTIRYYLTLEHELRQAKINYDYIEAGEVYDLQQYPQIAYSLFEHFKDVDAIVGSDISAAYCVQEALRRGIDIPKDLQVIAYDGTYLADAAGLRLTSVAQDFKKIAQLTSGYIINEIQEHGSQNETEQARSNIKQPRRFQPQNAKPITNLIPVRFKPGETTRPLH
jgi:LacI family sucrose operon transcriptional repressor